MDELLDMKPEEGKIYTFFEVYNLIKLSSLLLVLENSIVIKSPKCPWDSEPNIRKSLGLEIGILSWSYRFFTA